MNEDLKFGVLFQTSYEGIEEGKKQLKELKKTIDQISEDGVDLGLNSEEVQETKRSIDLLERSIKEAEDSGRDFGVVLKENLNKVQSEMKQTEIATEKTEKSLKDLERTAKGGAGFTGISRAAKLATQDIRGTETQLDKLRVNMEQGLGQTIAFGAIGAVGGAFFSALNTAQELDKISTDISIVSGKTADEMARYRKESYQASQELSTLTQRHLEASLIYEQQGGDAAYYAKELAESTVIAANITRETTSQMSEYLTSTINGFDLLKERGGEAGTYITDVMAKLGAASGSDLGEIAEGLTRTANTAKDAKFGFEEIATMIATVSEVTRRTPQTIGNAFKSIFTSFTQLREAGKEEVDAFTSKVEEAFKLGGIEDISMFDEGNLRDASDIFKDIAGRWETMSTEQQALVAEAIAGKQQAEVLRAFFNSQERYADLLEDAYESAGTAANQQLIFADSLEGKVNNLKNAWQGTVDTIVDSDLFKGLIEDLTTMVSLIADSESAFTGLLKVASPLVGLGGSFFAAPKIGERVTEKTLSKQQTDYSKMNGRPEDIEVYKAQEAAAKRVVAVQKELSSEGAKLYGDLANEASRLTEEINSAADAQKSFDEMLKIAEERRKHGGIANYDNVEINTRRDEILRDDPENEAFNSVNKDISKAETRVFDAFDGLENIKDSLTFLDNTVDELVKKGNSFDDIVLSAMSAFDATETTAKGLTGQLKDSWASAESLKDELATMPMHVLNTAESEEKLQALLDEMYKSKSQIIGLQEKEIKLQEASVLEEQKKKELVADTLAMEEISKRNANLRGQKIIDKQGVEQRMESMDKAARKGKLARYSVQGLTSAFAALTPAISAYNSVQKETITLQEGIVAGLQGIGSGLLMSMNPYAMAAGGVTLAVAALTKHFDVFTTSAQKAAEANKELIKTFISLQEKSSSSLSGVQDIQESYTKFQGVDMDAYIAEGPKDPDNKESVSEYDSNLEEYYALSSKIADLFPHLIKGYDETGRVVVDLTKEYKDLNEEVLKSADENNAMMKTNSGSFMLEQSANLVSVRRDLREATSKLVKEEEKLSKFKEAGNAKGVSETLSEIATLKSNISEFNSSISSTRDSVQANVITPFNHMDESARKLKKEFPELSKTLTDFTGEIANSENIFSILEGGDDKQASDLLDNLGYIRDEVERLAQTDPSGAEELLNKLNSLPEVAKSGLYQANESFEDLMVSIDSSSTSSERLVETMKKYSESGDVDKTREMVGALDDQAKTLDTMTDVTAGATGAMTAFAIASAASGPLGWAALAGVATAAGLTTVATKLMATEFMNTDETIMKALEPMSEYNSHLNDISEAYERSTSTAKGYNEAVADVQGLEKAISAGEELAKVGTDSEAFKTLKNEAPEVASALENAYANGEEAFSAMLKAMSDEQETITSAMMGNNEEYFEKWKEGNLEAYQSSVAVFGAEAEGAKTLKEFKTLLESASLSELRQLYAQRVEAGAIANGAELENYANFSGNMVSLGDVWGNELLSWPDKIKATFDQMWQSIVNKSIDALNWVFEKLHKARKFLKIIDKDEDYKGIEKKNKSDERYFKKNNELLEQRKQLIEGIKASYDVDSAEFNAFDVAQSIGGLELQSVPEIGSKKLDDNETNTEGEGEGEEKDVENLELELDRYYKLNNILKRIQDEFTELGKRKDAAYGQDKLRAMKDEQALLAKQASVLREYSAELKREQSEVRNSLSGNGFRFDANGDISNLNQRLTALQNAANSKSGEAKEAAIEQVKEIQEEAQRYSEITFNLIPEKQAALSAIKAQLSDIAKEQIEYKVKLQLDTADFKSQLLDVVKEMQDGFSDLDEKSQITKKQMVLSLENIALHEKKIKEIRESKDLTAYEKNEMLNAAQKDLLSAISSTRKFYNDFLAIQEEFVTKSVEAISKITDRYENVIDKTQQMIDKNKELYGTGDIERISSLYEVQVEALDSQLIHLKNSHRELIRYRDSLEEGTKAWEKANEEVNAMSDSISEGLIKKMDILKAKFEDFSSGLASSFEKMFGAWGLQGTIDDFDKLIAKQNKYMSSFEKYTSISTQIKNLNDEIAKSTDPQRAKELVDLRDKEFSSLLSQEKVSEAEYDRAMKLYELKQKELAIQERENAKRTVQMIRDENGNMTYQYVRQESEDLSNELDEIQKKKDDLYKFDSDQVRDSAKGVFDVIQLYQQQLQELQSKGLNAEEFEKELNNLLFNAEKDIKDKTTEMYKWIENAGKDGLNNLQGMISSGAVSAQDLGTDAETLNSIFSAMADGSLTIKDIMEGNYNEFANSIGETADTLGSTMDHLLELILGDNLDIANAMEDASNKWSSSAKDNVNSLGNAYEEYMSQANKTLGDYNVLTGSLNTLLKDTDKASKDVATSIKKQTDEMIRTGTETSKTATKVKDLENKLIGTNGKSGLYGSMVKLRNTMNNELQPAERQTAQDTEYLTGKVQANAVSFKDATDKAKSTYTQLSKFGDKKMQTSRNDIQLITDKADGTSKAFRHIKDDASKAKKAVEDFSEAIKKMSGYGSFKVDSPREIDAISGSGKQSSSFATGGYTGTWSNSTNNSEGRMALLHEKELVLNKDDTNNILSAVNMQRKLMDRYRGQGDTSKTIRSITENIQNKEVVNNNKEVSQPITINADFPNVKNSLEIENAFQGLFSKASTFVGKK